MAHVEALREVKRAESEVRKIKEEAARQAQETLRDAERRANDAIERAKSEADARHTEAITKAQKDVAQDRAKTLRGGEAEASKIRAKGASPDFGKAVDLILRNFESRIAGKR